ncbi:hypothetical protein Plhal304r1_c036g0110611 [Plasmopara halstedii]
MSEPHREKKWRQTWQNAESRAKLSRPTDAVFKKPRLPHWLLPAMPVTSGLCIPMWIPARALIAMFSDTEFFTSLGSSTQSLLWSNSLEHLRAIKQFVTPFKRAKNTTTGTLRIFSDFPMKFSMDLVCPKKQVYITPALVVGGLRSFRRRELREEGKSAQQSKEAPSGLNADDTTSILPAFDDQTPVTVLPWPTTLGRTGRRGSCGGSATPSYSQENSSLISTINFYEWLTGGLDGSISPDQNVILWDKAIEPPQSLTSFVALTEVSEAVLMGPSTEAMLINSPLRSSAKSLTNIGNFNPNCTDEAFHHLRTKGFGHAVLRKLSTLPIRQLTATVSGQLCPEQSQFWLRLRPAKADLAL